jgi:hypothetical protein
MKIYRMAILTLVAVSLGMVPAARADHEREFNTVSQHAEMIVCASRELKDELKYRFHCSRLFGELMSTNTRIRARANALQAQAGACRCGRDYGRLVCDLETLICRLDTLIDEAAARAARGIDPPIGCERTGKLKVARMREALACIKRTSAVFGGAVLGVRHDDIAPDYSGDWDDDFIPGNGYGPGFPFGNGSGFNPGNGLGRGGYDLGYGSMPNRPLAVPGYGGGLGSWNSGNLSRGLTLDRGGLTYRNGGFSVHLAR